ncbi:calcium-binding protein [Celeribacter sp. ULVN23_4]
MLGIILLSTASWVAIGSLTGLIDWSDDEKVQDDIDEAGIEDNLDTLDDTEIVALETAFEDDPVLAQGTVENEEDLLVPYEDTDWSYNEGTEGDDFIAMPDDLEAGESDMVSGNGGDDVILGSDGEAWDVLFGDEGDDTIFGRGGFDQIFGDDGDDTLSGGEGGDLIVAGDGSDVVYGGAGDDNIFDGNYILDDADETGNDVISAGDGDDGILLEDGINLVSLGEGEDNLMLYGESGESVAAVVTDFDPEEDGLLLGVYAPDYEMPEDVSGIELEYSATEIETSLGMGTLIQPVVDEDMATELGEDITSTYVFLLGVTLEDLEGSDIRVVLQSDDSTRFGTGSIWNVSDEMGATWL